MLIRHRIGELEVTAVTAAEALGRGVGADVVRTETAIVLAETANCVETVTLQDGREARLRPGDFTLCDLTRPYVFRCDGPCNLLVVGIPRLLLLRYVAFPEELTAVAMSSRDSMNGLVSDYLHTLWGRFPQGLPLSDAWQVCQATMNLVGGAYERLAQDWSTRRSAASAHRARIRCYIEKHLTDPDLTPASIASSCQINVRYMHRLQALENETLARYISGAASRSAPGLLRPRYSGARLRRLRSSTVSRAPPISGARSATATASLQENTRAAPSTLDSGHWSRV